MISPTNSSREHQLQHELGQEGGSQLILPTFSDNFLLYHAGSIITDPRYAVVELVANSWDAGADHVEIEWPSPQGGQIAIADNGTGMTQQEFLRRWAELNYNRLEEQGPVVVFPKSNRDRRRLAFGRNGVGRHAMFCFANEYWVETSKGGETILAHVTRSSGKTPFQVKVIQKDPSEAQGTRIYANTTGRTLPEDEVVDLIGSRFVADPEFVISVNGREIALTDLDHLCETSTCQVEEVGEFKVRRYDSEVTGRTSKHHGVAWWVNGRLVGNPSWEVFDEPLIDSRLSIAKRFTYIVEADPLGTGRVKKDWSGFFTSKEVLAAKRAVADHVRNDLRGLLSDARRERKRDALIANRHRLQRLPTVSQVHIAQFAEEIQVRSPTITTRDLENAVEVLATLEQTRTGYSLLEKLSQMAPEDLEGLDAVLDEWSIQDARKVLDELRYRLTLISHLEALVESHTADELHDLQPLFERGLWIFGPELESISFTSNRSLATVVKQFLGDATLTTPKNRPDFVALPNASIGLYSSDSYDSNHEVNGLASVVIVELKRGGFEITTEEKDQAMRYTREIRRSGKVEKSTKIIAYVLGTKREDAAEEPSLEGSTVVYARTYGSVLRQAHARTFHLLKRIEGTKQIPAGDQDLQDVLSPAQLELDPNTASTTSRGRAAQWGTGR